MTDKQIQKKLNQLAKIANELGEEAIRRYGDSGNLFFESDGNFHLMSGDSDGGPTERQEYVKFSSAGHCTMGSGAW